MFLLLGSIWKLIRQTESHHTAKSNLILSCSWVGTNIWLHYLVSNKTLRENKDPTSCFQQILEAALNKMAIYTATNLLSNKPSKISKLGTAGLCSFGRPAKNYVH